MSEIKTERKVYTIVIEYGHRRNDRYNRVDLEERILEKLLKVKDTYTCHGQSKVVDVFEGVNR